MSLTQINADLLLDFVNALEKVAPLSRPQNDQDLEQIKQWGQVASYVAEMCRPLSHEAGFDSAATYWHELAASYKKEAQDYSAQHQDV